MALHFRLLCLVPLLFCACTTARQLQQPLTATDLRELNDAMRDREVDLYWLPEGKADYYKIENALSVHLAPGRVRLLDESGSREIPALALHSLNYLSPGHPRLRGALEGALVGGVALWTGLLATLIVAVNCKGSCTTEALTPALIGAGLGVLCPVIGALIGHHDEVLFSPPR